MEDKLFDIVAVAFLRDVMKFSSLVNYEDPDSFASRLRRKRMNIVIRLMESAHARKGVCRILDIGGTYAYWRHVPVRLLDALNVEIVLLNLSDFELPKDAVRFSKIIGDACDLTVFSNGEFDLTHSNSVIEHVGSWDAMTQMAKEMSRVGCSYYVQTPYFWFPIEPHFLCPFLHFMPLSLRVKIARRIALGNWPRAENSDEAVRAQQSVMLLDKEMMISLFPDAVFTFERLLGIPKSIIAYSE